MTKVTDEQLYKRTDEAVLKTISNAANKNNLEGLARAVDVATGQPLTAYHQVNEARVKLDPGTIDRAASAFEQVTGFEPSKMTAMLPAPNPEREIAKKIINFNAFYIYFPVGLALLFLIWLLVGFGAFNWMIGMYTTVLVFLILYVFDMIYRIEAIQAIDKIIPGASSSSSSDSSSETDDLTRTFVAYLPQIVHAVAQVTKNSSN